MTAGSPDTPSRLARNAHPTTARAERMQQVTCKKEAVRLAKEVLGDVSPQELAGFIEATYGLTIQPVIVNVLLGSLRERAELDRTGRAALEKIEKFKAEQPPEAPRPKRRKPRATPDG